MTPDRNRILSTEDLGARVLALERVSDDRWARLDRTLGRLESALERMDRRLWLAASACAAAGAGAVGSLLWRALSP